MTIQELVRKTRSYRRFEQTPLGDATLRGLVDMARLCASGGNKQPLKYLLSSDATTNAKIFPATAWAGALKVWPGPAEGERPTAYIVILLDREIGKNAGQDTGIAAQTMALAAMEQGIGACMIGSINRGMLRENLGLAERFEIELVLALGIPGETVVLDEAESELGTATDYCRDENDVHHVPKRSLTEVLA